MGIEYFQSVDQAVPLANGNVGEWIRGDYLGGGQRRDGPHESPYENWYGVRRYVPGLGIVHMGPRSFGEVAQPLGPVVLPPVLAPVKSFRLVTPIGVVTAPLTKLSVFKDTKSATTATFDPDSLTLSVVAPDGAIALIPLSGNGPWALSSWLLTAGPVYRLTTPIGVVTDPLTKLSVFRDTQTGSSCTVDPATLTMTVTAQDGAISTRTIDGPGTFDLRGWVVGPV